ncbi:MAG: lysophospholipid acyltransferase family protein, partial [Opitutales bacterium]
MPTHKKPETECFKGPAKYAVYLIARTLVAGLQRLPIGLAYRLGRGVGWLAWKCLKRRRATVRKNLEIVNAWMQGREACPQASANAAVSSDALSRGEHRTSKVEHSTSNQPQKTQVSAFKSQPSLSLAQQEKEVFLRAGANLFAGFTFNRMSPEQVARHIEMEGIEHLQAALAEGKGVIVLLAHMGPWEALAQLSQFVQSKSINVPFGAMYRPLNNAYLDEW